MDTHLHTYAYTYTCLSNSSERPSANTDVKNSQGVNNNNDDDMMMKVKENEKRDNYLDLAREIKKLWNMKAA